MFRFLCEETTSTSNDVLTRIVMTVLLIVVMAGLLVMPYINSKKRNKEYEAMVNSLKAGDLVKTAGGIIGRIVKIMNKGEINTVILETGSKTEKSYMEFDLNMIYCVLKSAKADNEEEKDDDLDEDETDESLEETTGENKNTENEKSDTQTDDKKETEVVVEEVKQENTENKDNAENKETEVVENKENYNKKTPIKKTTKSKK